MASETSPDSLLANWRALLNGAELNQCTMIRVPFHCDEFSCGGYKELLPVTVYNQTSKKYMLLTKTFCFSPRAQLAR